MSNKLKIHVVFFGDKGHGKSTLIGRLILETGRISIDMIKRYQKETRKVGREGAHFAWILDQSTREREEGFTADIRFQDIQTNRNVIWAIDTPGHGDHIDRVAIGLSEADAGVLVVAVDEGFTARTEEQAVLARMLGIEKLIVAITKTDLVNYSRQVIDHLERDLRFLLLEIGYEEDKIKIIPISALYGINIVKRGKKIKWYKGRTFLETLDGLEVPSTLTDLPFRLPIDTVFYKAGVGTIVCGKISSGTIKKGDRVVIEPGGKTGNILSIEEVHQESPGFEAGDNVGMLVEGIETSQVDVGYVMGHLVSPPISNSWFTALVNVLHYPARLYVGQSLTLLVHTAQILVTIENIICRLDPRSEKKLQDSPPFLRTIEKGIIQFRTHRPVVIEYSTVIPQLSRFVLRESYRTIAAGVRIEV